MGDESVKRSSYRAALRSRDLRRLLGSQLISSSGSWAYNVALAVFLYERTHSAGWVAAGSLGRFLPSIVWSPYAGVVAERFERVGLMVRANVLACCLQLGLAVEMWQRGPVAIAVVIAGLTSLVQRVYNPAVAAMIPQMAGEDDLAAANALNGTIDNLVIVVGPAVGAVLLIVGGPTLTVLVDAGSFLVAAAMVGSLTARSTPSDVTAGGTAGVWRQVADGFRTVASSTTTVVFVSFSVVASFIYGADTVLFAPIARTQLHTGTNGYGYLLAGLGVGGVAGAMVVNWLASQPRLAGPILGGIAVYCVPMALMVMVHQQALAFVLEVFSGAGTLVVDTLAITALQRSAPKEMVARVFGVFFALALGAMSLGALLTPVLLRAGLHSTMLLLGAGTPLLCTLSLPILLRLDRATAAQADALAPRVAILERLDLFSAASRTSLEMLASSADEVVVAAGTAVVTEGDIADAFYAVVSGALDVSAVGDIGDEPRHLTILAAGTYFGEIGLIAHVPRTATVTAVAECTLLRIDGADFLDALTSMSASPSLIEGARTRLSASRPASTALDNPLGGPVLRPGAA